MNKNNQQSDISHKQITALENLRTEIKDLEAKQVITDFIKLDGDPLNKALELSNNLKNIRIFIVVASTIEAMYPFFKTLSPSSN